MSPTVKQSGSYNYGLFTIVCIIHLAHGCDPSLFVFHKEAMRNHFIQCIAIESQSITLFPTIKKRRQSVMANTIVIGVYCYCRCPDNGSKVVLCDGTCGQWYHLNCLKQDTGEANVKNPEMILLQLHHLHEFVLF